MVRTVIRPSASRINLSIPVEYIGEELEILVFPVNSVHDSQASDYDAKERDSRRREAFQNFMRYKGTLTDDDAMRLFQEFTGSIDCDMEKNDPAEKSPFEDIPGVKLNVSTQEIVELIREQG